VTRVVIADDQDLARAGFRLILELAGIEVVAEASDGREALEAARALQPEVVLMDVRVSVMDGIEATRRIAQAGLPSRVLMLTTFDLDEYVVEALRAGAGGFVLKDIDRERLVEAVRTVAAGDALFAPSVLRRLMESHVRAILAKLRLRDRVQAVVFAYETGLVIAGRAGRPTLGQCGHDDER
jgi:DNA-binding NarL/FixJ family response regulator